MNIEEQICGEGGK